MINTIMRLMLVSLLTMVAAPAYSDSVLDIFMCQQDEDATEEDLVAIASKWLKAVKGTKGGAQMDLYLRFPVVAEMGENDFAVVLVAPSLEEWARFVEGVEESEVGNLEEKFDELADCPDNSLWDIVKVE